MLISVDSGSCNYLQTDFNAINANVEKAYKRREKVHLALDQIDRMIKTWDEVRLTLPATRSMFIYVVKLT